MFSRKRDASVLIIFPYMANLLFCLQLSPVDAPLAVELAKLIADIEDGSPCKSKPPWLVSFRKDTPLTRVAEIESQLCNYFDNVWVSQAREHAIGWPAGPNALWRSAIADIYQIHKDGVIDPATGVLLFEPDCVPGREDWIDALDAAYGSRTKPIMGNIHDGTHINGNAIYPLTAAKDWPNLMSTPRTDAWDWFHRTFIMKHGEDTPLITQLYKRKQVNRAEWNQIQKGGLRPALIHGIKDRSGQELAREDLCRGRRVRKSTSALTMQGKSFQDAIRGRTSNV
jgi:hypothetical protein